MKGILVQKKEQWPGFALAHSLPLEQATALPGSEAYGDLLAQLCRWRESSRRSELVLSLHDTPYPERVRQGKCDGQDDVKRGVRTLRK